MYYLNSETGEVTFNRREAADWNRIGVTVQVWKNEECRLLWENGGKMVDMARHNFN